MARAFFRSALGQERADMRRCALVNKSVAAGSECVVLTGPTDVYGYGIYRVTMNGKRLKLLAHRLMFFVENSPVQLCSSIHVSHVCHNKPCVNIDHLLYEPASVNNARKVCTKNGECTGHRAIKRCLLTNTVRIGCFREREKCSVAYMFYCCSVLCVQFVHILFYLLLFMSIGHSYDQ